MQKVNVDNGSILRFNKFWYVLLATNFNKIQLLKIISFINNNRICALDNKVQLYTKKC